MKKAVVTGGAGFIGCHLVDRLVELGWDILVIDNLYSGKEEFINKKAHFIKEDIRSKGIENIIKKFNPSVLFHLAAQIDVRISLANPMEDANINILGTLNLLKSTKQIKDIKFIFSSTGGAIYGDADFADELTFPLPISPYGVSKLACEGYIKSIAQSSHFRYTILRYGNVYGPRQDPNGEAGVVAILTGKLLNQEKPVLYGYGKMIRDYVYVDDVVDANILSVNKGDGWTLNIGTGKPTTVNEIYKNLSGIFDTWIEPESIEKRPGEIDKIYLNPNKAAEILNWKPKTSLEQGLKKTVEWFKKAGNSIIN